MCCASWEGCAALDGGAQAALQPTGMRKARLDNPTRGWIGIRIRLARSPGHRLRMSDLAMQTSLTPSGLTRAVDRLEEAGFVERVACPSDRRGAFAALTDAGLARITEAVGPHLLHVEEHLTGLLSADEQRDLARLLRKVRDHVNPEAAVVTPPPGDETDDAEETDEAVA